jgi:hypothetical protein
MKVVIFLLFFVQALVFSNTARAAATQEKMNTFLMTCAYGTGAGALLGLASLAFVSDPSSKSGNIARGASLGLYAGIGLGFYFLYGRSNNTTSSSDFSMMPIFLPQLSAENKVNGIVGLVDVLYF